MRRKPRVPRPERKVVLQLLLALYGDELAAGDQRPTPRKPVTSIALGRAARVVAS